MFDVKLVTSRKSSYCGPCCLKMILDYYGLETLTEEDAANIHQDYITARRKWIAEIQADAEKEYTLGDVDKEVLDNFITQLKGEMDYENEIKIEP